MVWENYILWDKIMWLHLQLFSETAYICEGWYDLSGMTYKIGNVETGCHELEHLNS